ncbi:hypothetical protein FPJ88_04995 [Mycobacterium tuberculosis]|nr:hypothetical protein FPJ92_05015 [Mycobacterium tuberculosis]QON12868.1 hypothetical protein FPJ90_05015 [Mycobacterium tuberculosis]QON21138.1 hypothetical protein FPJ88_04995 [Mycobacterium tuberculosis]
MADKRPPHTPERQVALVAPATLTPAAPRRPDATNTANPPAAGGVNRPGMSGDSSSWKGWGHVRWFIEEVPAGAA